MMQGEMGGVGQGVDEYVRYHEELDDDIMPAFDEHIARERRERSL